MRSPSTMRSRARRLASTGSALVLLPLVSMCARERNDHGQLAESIDAGASVGLDSGKPPSRALDGGKNPDGGLTTLPSASADACIELPLLAPPALCGMPDPSEPNSLKAPALLSVGSTCGLVYGLAADKDEDAYRFTATKSDPVLIELSYSAQERATLQIEVDDALGRESAHFGPESSATGSTAKVAERGIFMAGAGSSYDVQVQGDLVGMCLPYALRVNPHYCTDGFEDNDTELSATKLTFSLGQSVRVDASAAQGDPDHYEFITPKADPVALSGSYSVQTGDTLQLRRSLVNTSGLASIDVQGSRTTSAESFTHWLVSNAAGAVFHATLEGVGSGCAPYHVTFDVGACTDSFEDNDTSESAAPLAPDRDLQATLFLADDDFYDLSQLAAAGSCSASYTLAADSAQALRLTVSSASSSNLASSSAPTGSASEKAVTVSWGSAAAVLKVEATERDACQPYVLRCSARVPTQ